MKNEEKLRNKAIFPLLLEFSIPAMIGMIVNAIYNIVDRMFIGNTPDLGSMGLAAISITYPVTLVLMALSLMVGIGGATSFSIELGKGNRKEAAGFMSNAIILTCIFGLLYTTIGLLFLEDILKMLGASGKVLIYAKQYLSIILIGAVFQCVAMSGNNFSRAQGNPKNAMISQLLGAGFNIVFDYILIMIFHMGMYGAALATIGGQLLSAIWQIAFLFGKRTLIPLDFKSLKIKIYYILRIIKTGIPAFLMQMSNSVLNIMLNSTLLQYGGDIALSAIGIVTSVQTLLLMPITGLIQGQQPLVSYNYGARQMNRVKETIKYASFLATVIAVIGFIGVQFFTKTIVTMFNNEKDVVNLTCDALKIWFLMLPVLGAQIICANYFQSIGRVKISSVFNLLRQVILLIPLIFILSNLSGLYGIFYAVPLADGLAFIITIVFFIKAIKEDMYNGKD